MDYDHKLPRSIVTPRAGKASETAASAGPGQAAHGAWNTTNNKNARQESLYFGESTNFTDSDGIAGVF